MSNFEELSNITPAGQQDGSTRLTPLGAPPTDPGAVDLEQLRVRVAETRVRTMELIARYFAIHESGSDAIDLADKTRARWEDDRVALSASIAKYAVLLRALGESPERTVILIKTAFSEAAPHQSSEQRAILQDIVKWIVEAYYEA